MGRKAPQRLGALLYRFLRGRSEPGALDSDSELAAFPDLLFPHTAPPPDPTALLDLIDLAFLGRASAGELDLELDALPVHAPAWDASCFADDLFLSALVEECFTVQVAGSQLPVHRGFVQRLLAAGVVDLSTLQYRQSILAELAADPQVLAACEVLLLRINHLLKLLRASRDDARLEPIRFRFDVLTAFAEILDQMASGFSSATSGLLRLHDMASTIQSSAPYCRMQALLEHHRSMAHLKLEIDIGADGKLRHLQVAGIAERKRNLFFRRPLRRWWDRLRIIFHHYHLDPDELVDRVVLDVYQDIASAMARVLQLAPTLELYLGARGFALQARAAGLEVCLPKLLPTGERPHLEGLFNPLLLRLTDHPVPTNLSRESTSPVTVVTGPNSGGKTRLLQAVGITQVLGQAGVYVPCARAELPVAAGLFASIIEIDRAFQPEGRLGTELLRLRSLFETMPSHSLVLLDELCSGTNPSEAIEIVSMVLRLLHKLHPVALFTTHFLDFAQQLQQTSASSGLGFIQAEIKDGHGATFRFIPGVAATSLAVGTAQRLGITLEELEYKLEQRLRD